ncbi:EpsG family protein [Atopobacter sp. AH10]|uniref:EpsG family protein n=1 Tax=Atopobacter sp. AH10 TaxID=2315861 RepID=UPI0013140FA5|nr:EpsG family protein [Atopobacter sp. AH10]
MKTKTGKKYWLFHALSILLILMLVALMCLNRGNPDFQNYSNFYWDKDDFLKRQHEMGFFWLTRLGRLLNLTYEQFYTAITGLGLFSLIAWFYRYSKYPALALAFYMVFPFLLDIVQLRNFLVMGIALWAFSLLMEAKEEPTYRYLSLSLLLLAGTIHNTAFIYIPFWLVLQWPSIWVILSSGLAFTVSLLIPRFLTEASLAQSSSHVLQRYAYLFRGQVSLPGRIFFISLSLALCLAVYFIQYSLDQDRLLEAGVKPKAFQSLSQLAKKLSYLSFGLMPLFFQSVDFFRIFRNFLPLYWLLFSIYFLVPLKAQHKRLEKLVLSLFLLGILCVTCYVLLIFSNTDNVIRTVFKENILLRLIELRGQ